MLDKVLKVVGVIGSAVISDRAVAFFRKDNKGLVQLAYDEAKSFKDAIFDRGEESEKASEYLKEVDRQIKEEIVRKRLKRFSALVDMDNEEKLVDGILEAMEKAQKEKEETGKTTKFTEEQMSLLMDALEEAIENIKEEAA